MSNWRAALAGALLVTSACASATISALADLDQPALKLSDTIALPGVKGRIDHLALDVKGKRLFVAALGNNTVEVVDLKSKKRIQQITGLREPQGIAFDAGSNQLFVAEGEGGSLDFYDATTFKQKRKITGLPDADNVRLSDSGKSVWVGYGNGALAKFDTSTGDKRAECKLPGHPESFQVSSSNNRVYVNIPSKNVITVVDSGIMSPSASWKLPARDNYPMALHRVTEALYVGCRTPGKVLAINTTSGIAKVDTPLSQDVDDIFLDLDRGRMYAACGQGFVDVFNMNDGGPIPMYKIATAPGARTCFYSPILEQLFVAVPNRGNNAAEIRVYSNPGVDSKTAKIEDFISAGNQFEKEEKLPEALESFINALHLDPGVTSKGFVEINKFSREHLYQSGAAGIEDVRIKSGLPQYGITIGEIAKMAQKAGLPVRPDSRNLFYVDPKGSPKDNTVEIGINTQIDDEGCTEGTSKDYHFGNPNELRSRISSVLVAYAAESEFMNSGKMQALEKKVKLIERAVPLRNAKQISVSLNGLTDASLKNQIVAQITKQLQTNGISVVAPRKGIVQLTFVAAALPGSKPPVYVVSSDLTPASGKFDWLEPTGTSAQTARKDHISKLVLAELARYLEAFKYAKTL